MKTNVLQAKNVLMALFAMLMPLSASAHNFEVDGIFYNITSSTELTVEVTYRGNSYNSYNNEYKGTVTIPSTVIYNEVEYRVTSIGDWTFWNCSLTAISIPESVTNIADAAFYYCHLPAITIPESVTNIGYRAFFCCSNLTTIAIPKSVTSIGDEAFLGCQNLTSIIMTEGITSIGSSTFEGCSSLTSINIPESITSIGNSAFERCSSLTSINIPGGVTSIGSYAFYGCSSLTSITIPEGVTRIESRTFKNCSSLTSISFSESMESIGIDAFFECYSLHTITIPGNVTSIGEDAFYGCRPHTVINYSSLPIKKGNSSYGYVAYSAKRVLDGNSLVSIGDYQFYTSDGVNYLANYIGDDYSLVLPNSHNGENYIIQDYAFYEHKDIQSLTIGNGVISIGSKAFSTTPVKTIWLTNTPPEGHTYAAGRINYVANEGYNNLSGVDIYPYLSSMFEVDGVKYVPVSPSERTCDVIDFSYEENINSIDLKETASFKGIELKVRKVMPYAFYGGKYITEVSLNIRGEICDEAFKNCSSLETLTLGENITSLGKNTFRECSNLQDVIIPNSVESMGEYCFYGCSTLHQATLGNGLKKIDKYVFSNCSSLESVQIGDSIKNIETYAFQGCSSLYGIIIPPATNIIGDYSFTGCSRLSNVIIENRNAPLTLGSNGSSALFADCPLDSVYIGGKINYNATSSKGYSPFYRNASLRTVVITDEESQIYDNEFYGCTALKNVAIGDGVTTIGDYAFSGCNSLEILSLGSSMKEIGAEAFSDCNNVTQIVSSAVYPPTCGLQALDDINKWDCQLNVPIGYKEEYTEAEQWKEFFFIEDNVVVPYYALTFIVDSIVYQVDSLPCGEFIIIPDNPIKEGHSFSGWSEAPATMPANDVVISGSFAINSYILEYIVDEEIYQTDTITYGDSIAVIPPLEKEGYTFSGWSEAPTIMPADSVIITGSFVINSYLLTYTIDGDTIQADSVVYGTEITVIDEPIKEGYTFSGWSEVPEAMPANNVTISGTFIINKYLVTFKIGDEVVASDSLEYGASIVTPEAPEKEGYTFNGWGEVIETVPANDVTIEGSYSVNSYLLTYTVDGEIVKADSIAYGTVITLLDEPTKEGYTFSGWSEVPETMPASDVTVSGIFTINQYTITYIIDGEVFATDTINYGEAITVPEVPVKENYDFTWIDEIPETMPAEDIVINGSYTSTDIVNIERNEEILYIYTTDGQRVNELQKGLNIVLLKDGSIRKVFQK